MDRSAIMRAVKGRDTGPEKVVRKLLREFAPGYRLHRHDVPGKPDIVYLGRKLAIFVHGCFWHGHSCARGARIPKNNAEYWTAKIERNRWRDRLTRTKLRKAGWRSLIVWECELRDEKLPRRLRDFLRM
jgi:DNA mismatch endonuclease (patch repair protein)